MLRIVLRPIAAGILTGLLLAGPSGCSRGPDTGSAPLEAPLTPESAASTPTGGAGDIQNADGQARPVDPNSENPAAGGTTP